MTRYQFVVIAADAKAASDAVAQIVTVACSPPMAILFGPLAGEAYATFLVRSVAGLGGLGWRLKVEVTGDTDRVESVLRAGSVDIGEGRAAVILAWTRLP